MLKEKIQLNSWARGSIGQEHLTVYRWRRWCFWEAHFINTRQLKPWHVPKSSWLTSKVSGNVSARLLVITFFSACGSACGTTAAMKTAEFSSGGTRPSVDTSLISQSCGKGPGSLPPAHYQSPLSGTSTPAGPCPDYSELHVHAKSWRGPTCCWNLTDLFQTDLPEVSVLLSFARFPPSTFICPFPQLLSFCFPDELYI